MERIYKQGLKKANLKLKNLKSEIIFNYLFTILFRKISIINFIIFLKFIRDLIIVFILIIYIM